MNKKLKFNVTEFLMFLKQNLSTSAMDYDSFKSIFHSSGNYSNHQTTILFKLLLSKNISEKKILFLSNNDLD